MRKALLLAVIVFASLPASGQEATTKVRSAASLPATCSPGDANTAADAIMVSSTIYTCSKPNTWTSARGLETENTWMVSQHFKGPIPVVDVIAFGARALNFAPSTTATCKAGENTCTFDSVANFQVGDGVTIRGRGAPLRISTPSTTDFTVIPSLSSGGMGLGGGNYASKTTVASATGSSKYSYELIARDQAGGYTAPSSPVTITNGQARLGAATCNVSTAIRSGQLNTLTFSAPCIGAVKGAAFSFFGSTSATFSGFYNIQSVNSPMQIVVSGPYNSAAFGWQAGDATQNSATGGTATFVLSNHLRWTLGVGVWQFYICAKRPGDESYALIGVTKPNTTNGQDVQFDDYGSPYNDNQQYPSYITNSLCNGGAAQSDPTTSRITNINGTKVTLSDTAMSKTSATTSVFDDAPAFVAAMNTVSTGKSGSVLIPWTAAGNQFFINSYFKVPANISVHQNGTITANETIELGAQTWDGSLANNPVQQFGYNTTGSAYILVRAVPGIYISAPGLLLQNLTLWQFNNTNGGLLELDESGNVIRRNVQYTVELGSKGYLGTAIWYRLGSVSSDNEFHLEHSLITVSNTSGTSWTPIFHVPIPQAIDGTISRNPSEPRVFIEDSDWSIRGFLQTSSTGSGLWSFKNVMRQGGITPLLWLEGSDGRMNERVIFQNVVQDTDLSGALAIGNTTGGAELALVDVIAQNLAVGAADAGGTPSPFTGFAPREVEQRYNATGRMPNSVGFGTCPSSTSSTGSWLHCNYDPTLFAGPNAELFFPLSAVASAPTTIASSGGSLPSLTLQAGITAVGIDGKETVISPTSLTATTSRTCPRAGNCKIYLSWRSVPYAVSYNLYGCTATLGPTCPAMAKQATGITTNAYSWTTLKNFGAPPNVTLSGQSGHTASIVWAPSLFAPPTTVGSLPSAASSVGQIREVNDSTAVMSEGQTCAGGSTNVALAFSNGTIWKCF